MVVIACHHLLQVRKEGKGHGQPQWVRIALDSQDGKSTYASTTTFVNSTAWELHNATLSALETDTDAKLSISFQVQKACCLHLESAEFCVPNRI